MTLTKKQAAVFGFLRETPGKDWTCKALAEEIRKRNPCPTCGGESNRGWLLTPEEERCPTCHSWGTIKFSYSDAYVVLQQLVRLRLVERRNVRDEWGDATAGIAYRAVVLEGDRAVVEELDALFAAPAFGEEFERSAGADFEREQQNEAGL